MTAFDGGRLGNILSQYASLYAYSRLLHNVTTPLLTKKMYTTLKTKIFPDISIKTFNSDQCNKWFNWIDINIEHKRVNVFTASNESRRNMVDTDK